MKRENTYLLALCLAVSLCAPFWGMSVISPEAIFVPGPEAEIFQRLRLPRAGAAFAAGAGLSLCGMVFQALLRNPLATPFTLGVSGGAAFGASVRFLTGAFPFIGGAGGFGAALAGGLLAMLLVWLLTRAKGGFSTSAMLLAGIIINFFFSSLVMLLQYLGDSRDSLRIMHWLMGSLAGVETADLASLAFVVIAGAFAVRRFAPELDLLAAGEEIAAARGVRTTHVKICLFALVSLIVSGIVSLTGPIGFVGLIIPHICRARFGRTHRTLLPAAFCLGGCFLVVCDLFSRVVAAPAEIPVGIVTALAGGPFFLWILFGNGKNGEPL
jgi:iron complex transport system permease protein